MIASWITQHLNSAAETSVKAAFRAFLQDNAGQRHVTRSEFVAALGQAGLAIGHDSRGTAFITGLGLMQGCRDVQG